MYQKILRRHLVADEDHPEAVLGAFKHQIPNHVAPLFWQFRER
jgi:hypothetical protein